MIIRYAILGLGALVLAGCAGDPTVNREAAVTLEPMPKPASLPQEIKWAGKGAATDKLVSTEGDTVTWTQVEGKEPGCLWTNDGWFAPSANWTGCAGSDGSQDAVKSGSIWPLEVGKSESYEVKGKDATESWQTTRTCTVKAAVLVTVGDKDLPAYEVVCDDKWRVRTWYVSPDLQKPVRYKNYHKKNGLQTDVTAAL